MSKDGRPTQRFVNDAWAKLLTTGDSSDWDRVVAAVRAGDVEYVATRLNLTLRIAVGRDTRRLLERVTQLRVAAGSPALGQMAEALHVSDSTISRFFHGVGRPNWPTTAALVQYLGGEPESFVEDWVAARREPPLKR